MVNDGTELRINRIRHSDLSDYTCVARNGEGRIHHTVKVVIAGNNVYSDDHDDGGDYGFGVKMSLQVKLVVMMWGSIMIMTEEDDDWNFTSKPGKLYLNFILCGVGKRAMYGRKERKDGFPNNCIYP